MSQSVLVHKTVLSGSNARLLESRRWQLTDARRVPVWVCVLVVAAAFSHASQSPEITEYKKAIEAYRRTAASAVEPFYALPQDTVSRALNDVLRTPSRMPWEELRIAAMLHTEAFFRGVRAEDGQRAEFHVSAAQRLLDAVTSAAPAQEDFAWRWYSVVPQIAKQLSNRPLGERLARYAQSRWGRDSPRTTYARALQNEARFATEGILLVPGVQRDLGRAGIVRSEDVVATAMMFTNALRQDPGLDGAALHLGRLRLLQGQYAEAAVLFGRALDASDPATAYLAGLFLGALKEREERFDESERLYKHAIEQFPSGQAAPLALAQLLSRIGRNAEAVEIVRATLRRGDSVAEPLWTLAAPPEQWVDLRFNLLRAEVCQ